MEDMPELVADNSKRRTFSRVSSELFEVFDNGQNVKNMNVTSFWLKYFIGFFVWTFCYITLPSHWSH